MKSVRTDRQAASRLFRHPPAGALIPGLRGDRAVPDEGPVKTGIIVESALPRGTAGRNSIPHQLLRVENALIQDILVHGDVCVALEVVQQRVVSDVQQADLRAVFEVLCVLILRFVVQVRRQNPLNIRSSEVFETYIYKIGLLNTDFSYSTAVGLFKSVVNIILVIIANRGAKLLGQATFY